MTSEDIVFASVQENYEPKLIISPWGSLDLLKHVKLNQDHEEELADAEDPAQKCGEVFRASNGTFMLVCAECDYTCMDLQLFGDHFRDQHCGWKDKSDIGDSRKKSFSVSDISFADEDPEVGYQPSNAVKAFVAAKDLITISNDESSARVDIKTEQLDEEAMNDDVFRNGTYIGCEKNMTYCIIEDNSEWEKLIVSDEYCSSDERSNFDEKKKIEENDKRNSEDLPFCAACSRGYKTENIFRTHLRKKHSAVLSVEDIKTKSFRHLEEAIAITLNELVCNYCFKSFENLQGFREHAIVHVGTHLFYCKFCPKSFGSQYNRQVHMNTHEDIRPYKCSNCPKAFSCPANLHNHERLHSNITKFPCQYCDKRFIKGSDRTVHERIHTKELPFQCEKCGKRFITPVRLRDHQLRHIGIKNFKCSECGKMFYNAVLLKYHMQSHSVEPMFACKVCGRKFRGSKNLGQHMALHAEVKKYNCEVCGKKFSQFAGLYKHKKTHGEVLK